MNRGIQLLSILSLCLFFNASANSAGMDDSALALEKLCKRESKEAASAEQALAVVGDSAFCAGYLTAYLEAGGPKSFGKKACFSQRGFSLEEVRRVFLHYTAENPAILSKRRGDVLSAALENAYPCPP